MPIGMFKLSQEQRKKLSVAFIALDIIQIILGIGMTSSSLYICIIIAPVLNTEKSEVTFAFTVTGIFGTHVIFNWIMGIPMCQRCLNQAEKKSTSKLLLIWICVGSNTAVNIIVIAHQARKINRHILRSMRNSLTLGMNHYLSDSKWKDIIDKLQYTNECCGIKSYQDWHELKWLSKYHVDVKSDTVKKFRTSQENLYLPVTPWSCCKLDFPIQCLHDPLQQAEYAHIWVDEPNIMMDSINTEGCLVGLKRPIGMAITMFVVFSSISFILHIAIFLIARILYTSSRNAILLNNPKGIAPGWLFGRGDCGYSRGPTLTEIMEPEMEPADVEMGMSKKSRKRNQKSKREKGSAKNIKSSPEDSEPSEWLELRQSKDFQPIHHSTFKKIYDESGEPLDMEDELKRLDQSSSGHSAKKGYDDTEKPLNMEEELEKLNPTINYYGEGDTTLDMKEALKKLDHGSKKLDPRTPPRGFQPAHHTTKNKYDNTGTTLNMEEELEKLDRSNKKFDPRSPPRSFQPAHHSTKNKYDDTGTTLNMEEELEKLDRSNKKFDPRSPPKGFQPGHHSTKNKYDDTRTTLNMEEEFEKLDRSNKKFDPRSPPRGFQPAYHSTKINMEEQKKLETTINDRGDGGTTLDMEEALKKLDRGNKNLNPRTPSRGFQPAHQSTIKKYDDTEKTLDMEEELENFKTGINDYSDGGTTLDMEEALKKLDPRTPGKR